MITSLIILTIVAFIAAIGAISRIQRNQKTSLATLRSSAPETTITVRDVESREAEKPQLQADLDSAQPVPSTAREASDTFIVPPLAASPEVDIPLATSLTVSELIHPAEVEPRIELEQSERSNFSTEAASEEHPTQSVLAEVSELEHASEKLERLIRQADNPDSVVRVAVAAALGELAMQRQELDQVIALLTRLSQDVDPQVRVQAAASLGMLPIDESSSISG